MKWQIKPMTRLIMVIAISVLVLGIIMRVIGSKSIEGELLQTYSVPREKPWIATFSEGHYYIFDSEPGAFIYGVSVEDQFEKKEQVTRINDMEIIDLKSEDGIAVWAESRPGRRWQVDVRSMNPQGIIHDIYTLKADKEIMQYPYVAIVKGRIYFTERHADGDKAVLWEYDLSNEAMRNVETIEEYEFYKPAICGDGSKLITVSGMQDGQIQLLEYNVDSKEKQYIPLPDTIDLVFGLDYDESSGMLAIYYREKSGGKECLGIISGSNGEIKKIDNLSARQAIERDRVKVHNKYVIWIQYTSPIIEAAGMREFRKMKVYNCENNKTYEREGIIEFCIDDDELYCFEATKTRDRELYHLEWP